MLAFAQNKDKGAVNETVEVVKQYEATIQDAQKVNIQPNVPEVEESKPKLDYNVPGRELKDFAFEAGPVRPLTMSKEKLERFNNSYIKLGFGTQLNPLAELAYNDDKTKDLRFGLFYNHNSAASYKNKLQRYSDDEIGVYAKYFPKSIEVGGGFTFHNYRTHFYGIDSSYGSDTVFKAPDVRQVFRTYDLQLYLRNAKSNKAGINYSQTLQFNALQETFGHANEWFIAGQTNLNKSFAKYHTAFIDFNFDVSRLKNDSLVLTRGIFTPSIGYSFNNDDWKGHAHFGFAADPTGIYFVTDIHVEKRIYMHNLIVYGGFARRYQKNSLESLILNNNFIQNSVAIRNSPVDDFNAGIKGTVENFSYDLAFNLMRIKNFALFNNDPTDVKRFRVVYDPNTWIYNFHFEAGYNTKEWLRILLLGDVNLYELKTEQRPWFNPPFKLTLRANYTWKNKLVAGMDLYAISPMYGRTTSGAEQRLSGTVDLNLNVNYIFNKHLSFYISGNNLFNIKYQQWLNYRSFGIIGNIGAKYSF